MIIRTAIFAAAAIALLQMGALAQSGKMYRVGLVSVGAPDAKERAGKIPILVTNSGDPVATSLAHPGATLPASRTSPASVQRSGWRSSRKRCRTSARSRCCGTPSIWA